MDLSVPLSAADIGAEGRQDKRPLVEWLAILPQDHPLHQEVQTQVVDGDLLDELIEDARYAPYVARQEGELRDLRASKALVLGEKMHFAEIPGLSREMIERLEAARPATLAEAGQLRGITPAALATLLVHARRMQSA